MYFSAYFQSILVETNMCVCVCVCVWYIVTMRCTTEKKPLKIIEMTA